MKKLYEELHPCFKNIPDSIFHKIKLFYLENIRKKPMSVIYNYLETQWNPNKSLFVKWEIWGTDGMNACIKIMGKHGKVFWSKPIKKGYFGKVLISVFLDDDIEHIFINDSMPIRALTPDTMMKAGWWKPEEQSLWIRYFAQILKNATHMKMVDVGDNGVDVYLRTNVT